ncbi:hypothetical protein IMZ31_21320 (plasmid) [Pontibacillus sp. ALD_SL1]|uniref:hypothetical protein n=1 Tax=Pontibacillus sp. ALD_SL1 TaxID=2777185 RepID=UPI001A95935D|nr:hypothetical protein [Pontibacillus sp. ALD_SL1]QST03092.1 hypothetical protein IMZ31_21320 [Pontibacillus sp. ALD_SL1]
MFNPIQNRPIYLYQKETNQNMYSLLGSKRSVVAKGGEAERIDPSQLMRWAKAKQSLKESAVALYDKTFQVQRELLSSGLADVTRNERGGGLNATVLSGDFDVSASSKANPGTYTFDVMALAEAMNVQSVNAFQEGVALGLEGDFKINGTTFSVTREMDIEAIVNLINSGTASTNVRALYEEGAFRLESTLLGVESSIVLEDFGGGGYSSTNEGVASIERVFRNEAFHYHLNVLNLAGEQQESRETILTETFYNGRHDDSWEMSNVLTSDDDATFSVFGSLRNGLLDSHEAINGGDRRGLSFQGKITEGSLEVILAQDARGYTKVNLDGLGDTITFEKSVDGVVKQESFSYSFRNEKQNFMLEETEEGTFLLNISGGGFLKPYSVDFEVTHWYDAVSTRGDVVFEGRTPATNAHIDIDNIRLNSIKDGGYKEATYEIDGVSYTSSLNTIMVDGNVRVSLNGLGETDITNTIGGVIGQELGLLDENGAFENVLQHGQEAAYTYNGDLYAARSNRVWHDGVSIRFNDLVEGGVFEVERSGSDSNAEAIGLYERLQEMIQAYNQTIQVKQTYNDVISTRAIQPVETFVSSYQMDLERKGILTNNESMTLFDEGEFLKVNENLTDLTRLLYDGNRKLTDVMLQYASSMDQKTESYLIQQPSGNLISRYY